MTSILSSNRENSAVIESSRFKFMPEVKEITVRRIADIDF